MLQLRQIYYRYFIDRRRITQEKRTVDKLDAVGLSVGRCEVSKYLDKELKEPFNFISPLQWFGSRVESETRTFYFGGFRTCCCIRWGPVLRSQLTQGCWGEHVQASMVHAMMCKCHGRDDFTAR